VARHDIREWQATRTKEELVENARKAGQASGYKRNQYKAFRDCIKEILTLDVSDPKTKELLETLGLEPTYSNAISLAAIRKAAEQGDMEAARFTRDTIGEKPTEALQMSFDKSVKSMDLSKLSDAELEALAEQVEG
jgi:hypothetical protein